jgi:hypothetical protein
MTLDEAIQRFLSVGRAEMLRWFTRNSCIHSTRATLEVFRILGFRARALPVMWSVENRATQKCYVSGLNPENKALAQASARKWLDLHEPGGGWEGHLVAIVEDEWWIDASFDQAGPSIEANIPEAAWVFKFGKAHGPAEEIQTKFELILDDGTQLKVQYLPRPDHLGYLKTEAWEDPTNQVVARRIVLMMQGVQVSDTLQMFTVYEKPRDFPEWAYIVRRWELDRRVGRFLPDRLVWAKIKDTAGLEAMRELFQRAGRFRMEDLPGADPGILEVWI